MMRFAKIETQPRWVVGVRFGAATKDLEYMAVNNFATGEKLLSVALPRASAIPITSRARTAMPEVNGSTGMASKVRTAIPPSRSRHVARAWSIAATKSCPYPSFLALSDKA